MSLIVNNFRRIILEYDKEPPYLTQIGDYNEFKIYSSEFDPKIYVVYNPKDKKYYPFENQGSDTVLWDLKKNIDTYFI